MFVICLKLRQSTNDTFYRGRTHLYLIPRLSSSTPEMFSITLMLSSYIAVDIRRTSYLIGRELLTASVISLSYKRTALL